MAFQADLTNPVTTPLELIAYGASYTLAIIAFTIWLDICASVFLGVPLVDFTLNDFSTLAAGKVVVYVAMFAVFMFAVRILHLGGLREAGDGLCYTVMRLGRMVRAHAISDPDTDERRDLQESNDYRSSTKGYVLAHKVREYALINDHQNLQRLYDRYESAGRSEQNALSAIFAIAVLMFSYQFIPISSVHGFFEPSRFYAAGIVGVSIWIGVSYFGIKDSQSRLSGLIYVGPTMAEKILGPEEYRKRHEPISANVRGWVHSAHRQEG